MENGINLVCRRRRGRNVACWREKGEAGDVSWLLFFACSRLAGGAVVMAMHITVAGLYVAGR